MTLQKLNKCIELRERLETAYDIVDSLKMAAYPKSPSLTGMPHSSSATDKVGDLAVEIADMMDKIQRLEDELEALENEIEIFLKTVDDERIYTIIKLRFIKALTWQEVAECLGRYSEESVRKLCYRYLDAL